MGGWHCKTTAISAFPAILTEKWAVCLAAGASYRLRRENTNEDRPNDTKIQESTLSMNVEVGT